MPQQIILPVIQERESGYAGCEIPSLVRAAMSYVADFQDAILYPPPVVTFKPDGSSEIIEVETKEPDTASLGVYNAANEALRNYFNGENDYADPIDQESCDSDSTTWMKFPHKPGFALISSPSGRIVTATVTYSEKGYIIDDHKVSEGFGVKPLEDLRGYWFLMIPAPPPSAK